jgi:hypothetical protein
MKLEFGAELTIREQTQPNHLKTGTIPTAPPGILLSGPSIALKIGHALRMFPKPETT